MKKLILLLIFIIIYSYSFAKTLSLKDKVIIEDDEVFLNDIVQEDVDHGILNIFLLKLSKNAAQINSKDILAKLFDVGLYDVSLSGEKCIVTKRPKIEYFEEHDRDQGPITYLRNYLESLFDKYNFEIEINIKSIFPEINIDEITEEYSWDLSKITTGIKDILNTKSLNLEINKTTHCIEMEINISSNLWISKRNIKKGAGIDIYDFMSIKDNIKNFDNAEQLVFDFNDTKYFKTTKNILPGEILGWPSLKELPLVRKGEKIFIIHANNGIEVTIPCTILTEGFENQQIRIQLGNGNEKYGILKYTKGKKYVEI